MVLSVCLAIIHVTFELVSLFVESKTSESPMLLYLITCYNSRERWVPRQVHLQNHENKENEQQEEIIVIDRPGLFCGEQLGFNIGFRFTAQSIDIFSQLISNMPIKKMEQRKTLLIDESFKEVGPEKMLELIIMADNKLNLKFTEKLLQ